MSATVPPAPNGLRRRPAVALACALVTGVLAGCQSVPLPPAEPVPPPRAAAPIPAVPRAATPPPPVNSGPANGAGPAVTAPPAWLSTTGRPVVYEREAGALRPAVADADWLAAWPAWLASCRALTAARNPRHAAWDAVCTEAIFLAPGHGGEVREFFVRFMDCYRVLALEAAEAGTAGAAPAQESGLMTGYYEPLLEGSRVRTAAYTVPLYRAPPAGVTATRRELAASGQLRGLELLWVRDPVEAFFLEIQGSGRVHLADGNWIRVAYAASNGLEYRSIGRWLADQGELPAAQVSQQAIRTWAQAHPQRVREMLEQNPRMVFFRELPVGDPGTGPIGTLGVALTPGISVAVDPRFVPLGAPLLIDTRAPLSDAPLRRLALAQDTGGAIRGPLRIDWFWGLGPDAGDIAGHQRAQGTVRLLVPRGVAPEALL